LTDNATGPATAVFIEFCPKTMKKLLILIATVLIASPAQAGGCMGKIIVGSEWTTFDNSASMPHRDGSRFSPSPTCRFKTNSALGKRILGKCPNGSQCTVYLSDNKSDHHVASEHLTINKWPAHGVERH
jgi:hypothetical protein